MRLIIEPNYEQLSKWAANYVAAKIKKANPTAEKPFVLGLPTGSSPLGMYKNLIELNKQGVISFQNIITFNMDEYVGLPEDHPESYHYRHKRTVWRRCGSQPGTTAKDKERVQRTSDSGCFSLPPHVEEISGTDCPGNWRIPAPA